MRRTGHLKAFWAETIEDAPGVMLTVQKSMTGNPCRLGIRQIAPRARASASSKPALDYLTASGAAAISIMHIMASEVDLPQHRLGGCRQP
jgi:hypothetical protein